jgi:ABC-type dipeptide/oligopeptide/nickel transport system permease subunit
MASAVIRTTPQVAPPTAVPRSLSLIGEVLRTPGGAIGAFLVLLAVVAAILAPWLAPHPIDALVGRRQELPSPTFWLGTDEVGRDVLSRLVYGARPSLLVGIGSSFVAATIGTTVGLLAGERGGVIDEVAMRVVDVFLAVPALILVLTFVAVLGPSIISATIAIGVVSSARVARVARAPVLTLMRQEFVLAAQVTGARETRIITRHLLPNVMAPLIVLLTLLISGGILTEATLSFLGLGVQPPTPSWGQMLFAGRRVMESNPGAAIFPGIAIMLTVLGFNLLGDALRDVLDPRLRQAVTGS